MNKIIRKRKIYGHKYAKTGVGYVIKVKGKKVSGPFFTKKAVQKERIKLRKQMEVDYGR